MQENKMSWVFFDFFCMSPNKQRVRLKKNNVAWRLYKPQQYQFLWLGSVSLTPSQTSGRWGPPFPTLRGWECLLPTCASGHLMCVSRLLVLFRSFCVRKQVFLSPLWMKWSNRRNNLFIAEQSLPTPYRWENRSLDAPTVVTQQEDINTGFFFIHSPLPTSTYLRCLPWIFLWKKKKGKKHELHDKNEHFYFLWILIIGKVVRTPAESE